MFQYTLKPKNTKKKIYKNEKTWKNAKVKCFTFEVSVT